MQISSRDVLAEDKQAGGFECSWQWGTARSGCEMEALRLAQCNRGKADPAVQDFSGVYPMKLSECEPVRAGFHRGSPHEIERKRTCAAQDFIGG